ncbi:integrase_H2C2 domain-containing protein [Trichonephila clavipes]|nr:integrase_H2C2 domain-containing protein [Trichonephila clavipes]
MAFLGKGKKQDMLQLAEELGINATLNMTVPSIKIAITNSEGYEEEFVKNLYETIIANGKRLEELERAEKIRLEELVKEQALKEKELQLKFDLERFKIESGFRANDESNDSTNACSVTSNLNLKKLIPDFDPKQSDISLYLVIFERQAKRASIEKKEWVGQLLVEILNAVQTRSQVKAAREERGIDSGDAKKGEDEVIIVSSDAEDEILIPALQEYVPELVLLRVTRENLINAQTNSEEIKSLYDQAASQVQVTNQVYSLEKELLVKNR